MFWLFLQHYCERTLHNTKNNYDQSYNMKTRLTTQIFTLLTTLLTTSMAWAQPYCTVKTFNIRDGLAANTISGIGQDNHQLMWFSTWNGLCSYDGYRFTTFRDTPGKNEVLTSNRLLMVMPNCDDDIWCISYDKRPYVFDTRLSQFIDLGKLIKKKFGIEFKARKFYGLKNGYSWIVGLDGCTIRIKDKAEDGNYEMQLISRDMPQLKGEEIRKVMEDGKGREWIATGNGTQLYGQKLSHRHKVEYLTQYGNRVFLASAGSCLAYYDETRKTLKELRLPGGISHINGMKAVGYKWIALATDKGILMLNPRSLNLFLLSIQHPSQPSPEVTSLQVDSKNRIWAFGSGLGASLVNTADMTVTWIPELQPSSPYASTSQKTIWVEDNNHTVWVSPEKGYFGYYDEQAHIIRPYILNSSNGNTTYIDNISKWFVDKQKNLWLTSAHDLTLVNLRTHEFKAIPQEKGKETRSTCCDAYGYRYFGTTTGNVLVYDKAWVFKGYLSPSGKIMPTPTPLEGKIYAIYSDRENRLWIGSKGGGLYVRFADGEMRHYTTNAQDKTSISSNAIYTIDQDNKGTIWIGSYGGGLNIATVNADRTISFRNMKNGMTPMPDNDNYLHVRRITHTPDGIILVSTTGGLITFSNTFSSPANIRFFANTHVQGDTSTLGASDVTQTLVARDGKVYAATMSGGLQVTDGGKNLLSNAIHFKTIDMPTSEEGIIQSLTEDRNGNIWIARESSIDMYNPRSGKIDLFGPNDFGEKTEFSEALSATDAEGGIMLGAMGGVIAFRPGLIKKSNYKPEIIFSAIQYQGETAPHPVLYTDRIEVPSDKRSFTINFAALDYQDNSTVKYAYKLQGIDKEWNYLSNKEHSVSYSHFPAGKYTLMVRSTNTDGVWVDNIKKLTIHALPTFWESVWAKLLYLLIGIAVIYACIRYYVLKHKAIMEHDMTEMKTRFFTEIGHKLRTPLTLIGGPVTEVLDKENLSTQGREQMEMVQRNSRNMLELVNQMLEHNHTENYFVDDANAPVFKRAMKEERTETREEEDTQGLESDKKTRLLVVEDNDDLRSFLVSILSNQYTMLQAENGKVGLETAIREMPEFIITDVMMPVMDGLTMVHQIKQNKDICHIPIIVLSAKASLNDRLQGLNEGIDDYITKPFSATYLRHRVENIIAQRKMLQQNYLDQLTPSDKGDNTAPKKEYRLEEVQIVDADKEMMDKLMAFLEENISNADLKIEDLSNSVNLGRTVFYEKMKSIVGMSPIDFLRHIRLQRAQELVAKSSDTFSQIAYAVGFTDPKYFGKCFKRETGMTPSEYREKAKQESN